MKETEDNPYAVPDALLGVNSPEPDAHMQWRPREYFTGEWVVSDTILGVVGIILIALCLSIHTGLGLVVALAFAYIVPPPWAPHSSTRLARRILRGRYGMVEIPAEAWVVELQLDDRQHAPKRSFWEALDTADDRGVVLCEGDTLRFLGDAFSISFRRDELESVTAGLPRPTGRDVRITLPRAVAGQRSFRFLSTDGRNRPMRSALIAWFGG